MVSAENLGGLLSAWQERIKCDRKFADLSSMWALGKAFARRRGTATRERRRSDRFDTSGSLSCSLGEVVNMSAQGMRVRFQGRPPVKVGEQFSLTLRSGERQLRLSGLAVHKRRIGLRCCEIGVQFVDLKPSVSKALRVLAQFGMLPKGNIQAGSNTAHERKFHREIQVQDHYRMLGVSPSATDDEIYHAHREQARKYHPDVNRSADAAEKFEEVSSAYQVLKDKDKRRRYDELIARGTLLA